MRVRTKYNVNYVFISKDAMFMYNTGYCMSNIYNNSMMVDFNHRNFSKILSLVKSYRSNK
jgi:hypothetical protein